MPSAKPALRTPTLARPSAATTQHSLLLLLRSDQSSGTSRLPEGHVNMAQKGIVVVVVVPTVVVGGNVLPCSRSISVPARRLYQLLGAKAL